MSWLPPSGPARAAGGLLGVVGGEAWRGPRRRFELGGPVAAALVDVSRAYVSNPEVGAPVEVARQHEGVPGPGWLLPVAFVRSDAAAREREVSQLAETAGMGSYQVPACVAYVELAANLFATGDAGQGPLTDADHAAELGSPRLLGVGAVDGLAAGSWALGQRQNLGAVIPTLVESRQNLVAPWVAAAAVGLLGVRDGCEALPAQWHRRLPRRQRHACSHLAEALVHVNRTAQPEVAWRA